MPFLRYFSFCPEFLVMWENGLIRKLRHFWKFLTSQTGHQASTIHILQDIVRSKGNQTLRFGQLIEFNMNNFPKKSCAKCDEETSPRPFLKNQNWTHLWINSLEVHPVCFYWMSKLRTTKIYWNYQGANHPLAVTSYKAFLKNRKRSIGSVPASFSLWFLIAFIFWDT